MSNDYGQSNDIFLQSRIVSLVLTLFYQKSFDGLPSNNKVITRRLPIRPLQRDVVINILSLNYFLRWIKIIKGAGRGMSHIWLRRAVECVDGGNVS